MKTNEIETTCRDKAHSMFQDALDDIAQRRRDIIDMKPAADTAAQVADEFNASLVHPLDEDGPAPEIKTDAVIFKITSGFSYQPVVSIIVFSKTMKTATAIRRRLRELGFPKLDRSYDSPYAKARCYKYYDGAFELEIVLAGKNAECKFVKTGERTVHDYKLVCDGEDYVETEVNGENDAV